MWFIVVNVVKELPVQ